MISFEFKKNQYRLPVDEIENLLKAMGASDKEINGVFVTNKKLISLDQIKTEHARLLNVLSGSKTPEDRDTWPVKKELVKDFLNGTAAEKKEAKAWLTKMLKMGETVEEFVAKTQAAIQANMLLMTSAEGMKRNGEALIESLEDVEAIDEAIAKIMADSKTAESSFKKMIAKSKA